MKHLFLIVILLMLNLGIASARRDSLNNVSRHEVRVGFAAFLVENKALGDYNNEISEGGFNSHVVDEEDGCGTSMSIEYYYHINKTFALGALFGKQFGHNNVSYFTGPDSHIPRVDVKESNVLYAMPAMKVYWLNTRYVNFYVKLAGGLVRSSIKTKAYETPLFTSGTKDYLTLESHVSFLCCELDLKRFGMHYELGVGAQGIFIFGLNCNF